MDNKTIYKKTLGFSLRRGLWDLISFVLVLALATAGLLLGDRVSDKSGGLIGLLIGVVVGIIIAILISRFITYVFKAAHIAMMTRAICEDSLPDNVIAEGKKEVKERFATVAAFFAITGAVKGIFRQLGNAITKLGNSIGGDAGGAVGGTISSAIQTVIEYLCDCCLGWVFYRKGVSSAKAACEGAVIFFRHGKTLAKNMGRVFGIGIASFVAIGGAFTGIFYLIFNGHEQFYAGLSTKINELLSESTGTFANILKNPAFLPLVFAIICAVVIWSILHSVFIKPFVLVGVLRNYINSGKDDIPSEDSFSMLDSKSAKFRKLHNSI